jgi:hypothetical protein
MRKLHDEHSAGRYLGGDDAPISPRVLQRMRQIGGGPAYCKVGAAIRYDEDDLDRYLEQCRRLSTSEEPPHVANSRKRDQTQRDGEAA